MKKKIVCLFFNWGGGGEFNIPNNDTTLDFSLFKKNI